MRDLTQGNIYKTFVWFAIPMVLSALMVQGYSAIDTVIAGKFLGSDGLAAIGVTAALISFISSAFWGLGNGFAIYVAKLFGAGEYKAMKSCIYIYYGIMSAVLIVVSALMIVFHEPIFNLLKVAEETRRQAFIYYSIYMVGFTIIILSANCLYIMNAMGVSTFPFYMSVVSAGINIFGNIFTVTVLKMGVAGIAISTVFAALVVLVFYVLKLRRNFRLLGVDKQKIEYVPLQLKEAISYSVPTAMQQMIMYVSSLFISPMVNGISSAAASAYTVVLRIYDINAGIYQNSAKTLSNYSAQCMGAKKYNKIKKGVFVGLVQGILFMLPILLSCIVFSRQIVGLFFPVGYDGIDVEYSAVFARCFLPFIIFNVINNLFHSLARGVNKMNLLVISTFIGSISRILSTLFFVKTYGMNGIYFGWVFSWFAEMVFVLISYFSGIWKPDELRDI